ncbi:MAG: sulfatase [Halanaerobiaceae bacterium]
MSSLKDLTKENEIENVLFIPVDDLRPELGCYGNDDIISPNIDKLAQEGMVFQRAYCQQAVCGPSRASLLSGCRPDTIGEYNYDVRMRDHLSEIVSLPQHFKENGYETVSVGKVYHHLDDDPQGWSKTPYRARGDWKGRGYLTDEAIEKMKQYKNNTGRSGLGPATESAEVADNAYQDGKNLESMIEELRRLQDRKFFLAAGFTRPHLPFNAPKKYWDLYKREEINLADNPFVPDNVTKYSLHNFGELRGYLGIPEEGDVPEAKARELIHGYYACVSYIDSLIGDLLTELKRLGLREKTMIVLWGDHGWKLGEHACWCKHTNFEIDTRAPLIISIPGMEQKSNETYALTEFVDIYPTLCELCDLEIPEHTAGKSLVPVLENPQQKWKKAAFSQYPRQGGEVMGYSVKTENYRYTEWQDFSTGEVLARELYDHQVDRAENVNVAHKDEYKKVVEESSQILKNNQISVK